MTKPRNSKRTVSSRMLPSDGRTRGGSHAADADTLWKKLARRMHPQVRGDTTRAVGRLDSTVDRVSLSHATRYVLGWAL